MEPSFNDAAASLARWKPGDDAAATDLINQFYPLIAKIVAKYLVAQIPPEDLIQEILAKIFDRGQEFKGQGPLEHWVAHIARMTCLEKFREVSRREIRWTDLTLGEQELVEEFSPEVARAERPAGNFAERAPLADSLVAREIVARLLETLAPEDRHLLILVDLEGFSVTEAAEEMNWGVSKIKMRLARARSFLRETFNRWENRN